MRLAPLALAVGLAAPHARLRAQPVAPAPVAAARTARLARELRPGRTVRVVAAERYFEGRVQSAAGDTVTLDLGAGALRPVPLADVERAFVRANGAGRGALIGGITGAVLVGGLGVLAVGALCDSVGGCRNDYPTAAGLGGVIGLAGGAIIGTGIGALTHYWRRVAP